MVKDLNRHIKFKNTEFGKVVKDRKKPKTMDKKQLMAIKSTLIGLTVDFETLDYFMFNLNFYAKDYLNEQTIEETKEDGVLNYVNIYTGTELTIYFEADEEYEELIMLIVDVEEKINE